jgi:CBS domain containing-hemolysin-like protein
MDAFSWLALVLLAACSLLFLFVATAEAGLISISRARVRLMVGQGVPRADVLHAYVQERESLLHALALARNLAMLASAGLAVAIVTLESGHDWALIAAVIVAALVTVAVLEALPRALVAHNPEAWGLRLAPFMGAFKAVFGGVARVLDLPARAMSRHDGQEEEEDLLRLMELEENQGSMEEDERTMIRGVFGLDETTVREIMTPRIDIAALDTESTAADAVKLIVESGYSRIPLYEKNADTIVGVIYAKDLFRFLADGRMPDQLTDIARKPYFVPDSKRVDDLLTEMRKQRTHMAIVVDEYGGTAGLVTIEDMLEEIVGEIEDEHDVAEEHIVRISDTEALLEGRVSIDDVNEMFHSSINAQDFDTIGGCVVHMLGRMPVVGDEAETDGLKLRVLAVDGHRVKRVRLTAVPKPLEPENGNGSRNGKAEGGPA